MYNYITDPKDPIISFIQNMRDLEEEVIVDSSKLISKFIKANRFTPIHLYIKKSLISTFPFESDFKKVHVIEDSIFASISGYKFSKGVLATFQKPQFKNFNELKPPFILLNGLTSPENIGSIVRTMAGLGFKSLIIDAKTCSPFLRRCIRVSMGNINFIDVHRTHDIKNFIEENELDVYYAANEDRSKNLYKTKPNLNSAFMIGSEGHGIDKDILLNATQLIKIPVTEGVLHYNASIACAIIASDWSQKLELI